MVKFFIAVVLLVFPIVSFASEPFSIYLDSDGGVCDSNGEHFTIIKDFEISIGLENTTLVFPGEDMYEQMRFTGVELDHLVSDDGVIVFAYKRMLSEVEDVWQVIYYPNEGVLQISDTLIDAHPCLSLTKKQEVIDSIS